MIYHIPNHFKTIHIFSNYFAQDFFEYYPSINFYVSQMGFFSKDIIIFIIIALQPFVGPWPLSQFLDPTYIRWYSSTGGSARRTASTYTQNNTNRINAQSTSMP
jgi:hypothetical protein